MLGCFHAYLENGSGAGTGPWKLDRLCKDFCNSFVLLVRGLGLEPRSLRRRRIYCPIYLLLAFFDQDTVLSGPVRLPIPPTHSYLET